MEFCNFPRVSILQLTLSEISISVMTVYSAYIECNYKINIGLIKNCLVLTHLSNRRLISRNRYRFFVILRKKTILKFYPLYFETRYRVPELLYRTNHVLNTNGMSLKRRYTDKDPVILMGDMNCHVNSTRVVKHLDGRDLCFGKFLESNKLTTVTTQDCCGGAEYTYQSYNGSSIIDHILFPKR